MLVRRSVLTGLGGLDLQLPIFGDDVDFGWRAAEAGHTTIMVPRPSSSTRGSPPRRPSYAPDRSPHALQERRGPC